MIEKIFDGYTIKARYFPSLICLVPFILGKMYVIDPWLVNNSSMTWLASYFGDATISLILLYILMQTNRTVAKIFFENKKSFPTVEFLLSTSKETTESYRDKIGKKVQSDFGLSVPTAQEQQQDIVESKKRIWEIIQLIINKVRNGHLVLKCNMEYGFFRNLAGGSLVALIASLILAIISRYIITDLSLYVLSLKVALTYFFVMLFACVFINYYSKEYARVLYREYLGS
jgi:hypothetical protein